MQFAFAVVLGLCVSSAVAVPGGLVNTGHSAQFRSQDSLGNYAFGYNEDHATGGTFRRESGSPGIAQGSYGLRTIDGRVRVVNYVADGLGFRANVQTNEPGVDSSQDPASVLINKAAAIVAPYLTKSVVAAPAPLAIQQSYEAPIVQKYEAAPIIAQAPIVQKYEAAPVIAPAPIVQSYEPAPIIEQAPIVQKYDAAPIIEQAPLVQKYDAVPALAYGPAAPSLAYAPAAPAYQAAPLLSGYTTKTYAAPAPILSSEPLAYAGSAYATKSVAPLGIKAGIASPVLAAKTLGAYPTIVKKK